MAPEESPFPAHSTILSVFLNLLLTFAEKGNSLKNLVFNGDGKGKKHPNVKALMGLCSAVVENKEEIEKMIADSQILTKEVPLSKNRNLARVLIAELVWGKGDLPPQCQAKPIVSVLKYKQFFTRRENHQKAKASKVPRWVRINTLKISPQKIDTELKKEGFRKLTCTNKKTYPEFLEMVKGLEKGFYVEDYHLKGLLLAFAPGTEFHQNRLYKDGSMVLQDKASCFTVAALNPPKGCRVLDACASPGMKTTQAAAATQVWTQTQNAYFMLLRGNKLVFCHGGLFVNPYYGVGCERLFVKETLHLISSGPLLSLLENNFIFRLLFA